VKCVDSLLTLDLLLYATLLQMLLMSFVAIQFIICNLKIFVIWDKKMNAFVYNVFITLMLF